MSEFTIYHNPRCSKSRTTLALLEDKGIAPDIVLYLETPPNAAEIASLLESNTMALWRSERNAWISEVLLNNVKSELRKQLAVHHVAGWGTEGSPCDETIINKSSILTVVTNSQSI